MKKSDKQKAQRKRDQAIKSALIRCNLFHRVSEDGYPEIPDSFRDVVRKTGCGSSSLPPHHPLTPTPTPSYSPFHTSPSCSCPYSHLFLHNFVIVSRRFLNRGTRRAQPVLAPCHVFVVPPLWIFLNGKDPQCETPNVYPKSQGTVRGGLELFYFILLHYTLYSK